MRANRCEDGVAAVGAGDGTASHLSFSSGEHYALLAIDYDYLDFLSMVIHRNFCAYADVAFGSCGEL